MSTLTESKNLKETLISHYELKQGSFFASNSNVIASRRSKALEFFQQKGFPGRKDEEYKYTPTTSLLKGDFSLHSKAAVAEKEVSSLMPALPNAIRIVIVNGRFSAELSSKITEEGLTISTLKEGFTKSPEKIEKHFAAYADYTSDPFVALNTALAEDGVFVDISDKKILEKPLYILYIGTGSEKTFNQPRALILTGKDSAATIVEHFETATLAASSVTNNVTEIVIGANAIIHHYVLENECENGSLINCTQSFLDRSSIYNVNTVTINGSLVRNNLNIVLAESQTEANLFGLYIADKKNHIDNHSLVDHRMPHCESNELYKGLMDGKGSGVFNGKIYVRQDAQKTNAFQSNKNIILSDDASINTKPQLEIYADDVKCSHGTTTGQIDAEALFYLRSRGISEDSAKKLIVHAYAADILENIKLIDFRDFVQQLVTAKLS